MKKLITITTLALLVVSALVSQTGCTDEKLTTVIVDIDWVNFIKFNDITYLRKVTTTDFFQEEDLVYFDKVRFKLADNVNQPSYGSKNGDAAYLEEGTPIYSIKGYSPDFRLIANTGTKILLYEADTNPHAEKGADLLDIGGKVEYIDINASDGKTNLASIKEESLVSSLVEMVLNAPVDQTFRSSGGSQLFIVFHLTDGTVVKRSFWPDDGELSRGIMVPEEFVKIIKSNVP